MAVMFTQEQADFLIASAQDSAEKGMETFLFALSHIPKEKLDWSPTPTAKSAVQIAAHTAVTAGVFAVMIRERLLPTGDEIPVFVARRNAAENALTDQDEMEAVFRKNTQSVVESLETLTAEAMSLELDTSLGWTMSMTRLMRLPGTHAIAHAAQLDYLQTCWDDQQVHF